MTTDELKKLSRENLRKSKQGSLCECYDEAFIKGYELSKKHIAELEKSCDETQELLDKQIEATYKLDKENAELKETVTKMNNVITETFSNLTKAKDIMKRLVDLSNSNRTLLGGTWHKTVREAENFLKESEVEE